MVKKTKSNKNTVHLWGDNSEKHWQLGFEGGLRLGAPLYTCNPKGKWQIVQIACGAGHTVMLTADNSLMGFGSNSHMQLCDNAQQKFMQCVNMQTLPSKIKLVVAGRYHTMVLLEGDTIYGIGYNAHGQLGMDTNGENVRQWTQSTLLSHNQCKHIYMAHGYAHMTTWTNQVYYFGIDEALYSTLDKLVDNVYLVPFFSGKSIKLFAYGHLRGLLAVTDDDDMYIALSNEPQKVTIAHTGTITTAACFNTLVSFCTSTNECFLFDATETAITNFQFVQLQGITHMCSTGSGIMFMRSDKQPIHMKYTGETTAPTCKEFFAGTLEHHCHWDNPVMQLACGMVHYVVLCRTNYETFNWKRAYCNKIAEFAYFADVLVYCE